MFEFGKIENDFVVYAHCLFCLYLYYTKVRRILKVSILNE